MLLHRLATQHGCDADNSANACTKSGENTFKSSYSLQISDVESMIVTCFSNSLRFLAISCFNTCRSATFPSIDQVSACTLSKTNKKLFHLLQQLMQYHRGGPPPPPAPSAGSDMAGKELTRTTNSISVIGIYGFHTQFGQLIRQKELG
jgi:hypothetical protein